MQGRIDSAIAVARAEAVALRQQLDQAPASEHGALLASLAALAGKVEELRRAQDRARSLASMTCLRAKQHRREQRGGGRQGVAPR